MMHLYAWIYESYGEQSFYVMAESEADARAAVEKELATWSPWMRPPQMPWAGGYYELRVLGPGEVVSQQNG